MYRKAICEKHTWQYVKKPKVEIYPPRFKLCVHPCDDNESTCIEETFSKMSTVGTLFKYCIMKLVGKYNITSTYRKQLYVHLPHSLPYQFTDADNTKGGEAYSIQHSLYSSTPITSTYLELACVVSYVQEAWQQTKC